MLVHSLAFDIFIKLSFKNFGATLYGSDAFLSSVATIGFIVGTVAQLLWGPIQDKLGFRKVYFFILIMQVILCFTMVQASQHPTLYAVWISVSFTAEGGHFCIFPPLANAIYGTE